MASFEQYIAPGTRRSRRIEAGYQNLYNDVGNWTGGAIGVGIQAGTNMSISAPKLSEWRGHPVTAQEMQALTKTEALQIYKAEYWDEIKGDQIRSQTIANFAADMKSSAGGNGIKELQKALNSLGENLSVDGSVGNDTVQAINRQNAAKLNNLYRDNMEAYYKRIGVGTNAMFLNGWLKDLDKDYPEMSITADMWGLPEWLNNKWWLMVSAVILLILIIILTIYYVRKT